MQLDAGAYPARVHGRPSLKLKRSELAQVSLTAVHDTSVGSGPTDRFNPLQKYRLTWAAPDNEWVEIEPELYFQQRTSKDGTEPDDDDDDYGGGGGRPVHLPGARDL